MWSGNRKEKSVVFFYNDYESLGVEYISAVLKNAGIRTSLIYKNLVDYYDSESSGRLYGQFYKKIAGEICARDPDILALSLLTDTFQINMGIAKEVKHLRPEIKIIVGGVHAGLLPQLTLSYPDVDALCIGEGEFPMLDYVRHFEDILNNESPFSKGVVYKQNGHLIGDFKRFIINEQLDDLPFPDKGHFLQRRSFYEVSLFCAMFKGMPLYVFLLYKRLPKQ